MPIDSDKDRVRLLISDVGGQSGNDYIFSDEEIETFLEVRKGNTLLAAALALEAIAGNEAQVSKRITLLDLSTDGPAVALELRQLAIQFSAQAHEIAGVKIGQEQEAL